MAKPVPTPRDKVSDSSSSSAPPLAARLVEPPRDKQEDDQSRVAPSVPCVAPTGSTAQQRQGVQSPPVGEKRLPWRLGCMADAMVSAKVGPKARFFSRERVDEIVLLLREAEKFILEGR